MVNDEWIGAAMTNDMVVVELLIHLRQSQAAPKSRPLTAAAAPLSWGLKQPRSRLAPRWKDADSTRCSPTTPLSWSGAASPSITADGCEESSRPSLVSQQASRSKASASATSACTGNSASTKRCRKNKTFAELKEEESVLLKERTHLEKELATLSATFNEQRARNESLKRIKFDLGATCKNSPSSASGENTLCKVQTRTAEDGSDPQSDSKAGRTESSGESGFLIPDLNMMPSEGDSSHVE
ncbi:uncharacterized protein LOC114754483 isoform X1 [Neltuma alba]|uniref:uncharacterized protein LOC114754483 isoform X1 n=1 Tax=Neltuma alba TaxID=207710 RepID=UPI0010A3F435|nr:uncharacterized protein LOC114754483 isoform X1 [Prosopis alba]